MRRSAWIFLAAILLPSLGLAWLAIHSVRDQQIVLEHQEAIISQNITDALAKSIQVQMDQVRADFVLTTQRLLLENPPPQNLAKEFNRELRASWPLAEIGFAVNLDGQIYSPKPGDSAAARTFLNENDRFLSNRENAEVYSNSFGINSNNAVALNSSGGQMSGQFDQLNAASDAQALQRQTPLTLNNSTAPAEKRADGDLAYAMDKARDASASVTAPDQPAPSGGAIQKPSPPGKAEPLLETGLEKKPTTATTSPTSTPAPATAPPQLILDAAVSKTTTVPQAQTATPASPSVPAPAPLNAPTATTFAGNTQVDANAGLAQGEAASSSSSLNISNAIQQALKIRRNVMPQQMLAKDEAALSTTVPEDSDFRRVIGTESNGELARFLENKLRLMVWSHAGNTSPIIFGAQLDPALLVTALKASFQIPELAQDSYSRSSEGEICVAILDDDGHPVAVSRPGFTGDWKHPFVATEIGESLPHWEAALYLVDPQQIGRAARTLRFTLGLIVLLLVAAIVSGGSLIAADVRRQLRLAQQKTDFVSNVSHELKTPLTSIRMFADLLAEKRVPDEARQATYLRIIAAEAARLTRLINNVLDFARMERGAPPGEHRACDLVDAVRDVIETCQPHLEANGVAFRAEIEADSLPLSGDRDALSQIILNLVSNAEKYGGGDVTVRVRRQETPGGALACVDVLDRGAGIPAKEMRTIFEPFHRLDDSLSSGIPGSGLGLTLARRMARSHGGDVTCSPRAGGGSCFTLSVPLIK